ncbi:hypothetical protein [Cohnella sp.]|uniref:hypothetical protein n=1 Tax=Cohnella sp. TaxID=1883426 RepID=UPI003562A9EC
MSKGKKKKSAAVVEQRKAQMKIVTSDTCAVCKTPCARGMAYLERMRSPGEVGYGVPCILTLPKRKA